MRTAPNQPTDAGGGERWLVACLCASWCRTCDDYRPTFAAAAAAHPDLRFAWINIEDHSDALSPVALNIDDFPTLLVARGATLRFFGPVLPHRETLLRTIDAARTAVLTPDLPGLPAAAIRGLHEIGERVT